MELEQFVEVSLYCYSELKDVGVECGIICNAKKPIDLSDVEWIWTGISESFWENHFEFDDGIAEAKEVLAVNTNLSFKRALLKVFGHFHIDYYINGVEESLAYNIDADEIMYSLLIE